MFREKNEANERLRYAISVCKGGGFKSPIRTRFAIILHLKDDLEKMGAIWQSRCLNWHLHQFRKELMTSKSVKEGCLK